jgi:hypothetical protein
MIRNILLIVFLLLVLDTLGQNTVSSLPVQYERGFIYLKNGSVLKGKYLYNGSMDKLRVISGKNSWIFDMSEVDRVSKFRPVEAPQEVPNLTNTLLPEFKWFNITEIGILAGNSDNSQTAPFFMASTINYQFHKNISAGLGAGIEFYKETYLPLTANVIYKFRNTRITPYGTLTAGYLIPVEDSRTIYYDVVPDYYITNSVWPNNQQEMNAKGGLLFNPSIGIMRQSWQGVGFSLALGYRFHRLHYKAEEDYRLDIDFNRLSIKLGIIIN